MSPLFRTVMAGCALGAAILFGAQATVAIGTAANKGRFEMVGATPKGVVTFDTATGTVHLGRPIFDGPTE